jgi:hypothetical protein
MFDSCRVAGIWGSQRMEKHSLSIIVSGEEKCIHTLNNLTILNVSLSLPPSLSDTNSTQWEDPRLLAKNKPTAVS